jgi:hypothetical protein
MAKTAGMTFSGTGGVSKMITANAAKAKAANVKLNVGYEAPYTIFVHERLDLYHEPPTQAKFLEQPAREWAFRLGRMVFDLMKQGKTARQALMAAGEKLLEESRKITPIDTGELRESGFVRLEKVS